MSSFSPDRLPDDPDGLAARKERRAIFDAYQAILQHPVFLHYVDLSVLARIATDTSLPAREQRRAAEVLALLRFKVLQDYASKFAVKEQVKHELGLDRREPFDTEPGITFHIGTPKVHEPRRFRGSNGLGPALGDGEADT